MELRDYSVIDGDGDYSVVDGERCNVTALSAVLFLCLQEG